MKKMKPVRPMLLVLVCLLPLCLGLSLQEDDLVFDDVGEETPTLSTDTEQQQTQQPPVKERKIGKGPKKWRPVEKLLGMPSAIASVGHVFKLHIPKQAFTGDVDYYEVSDCIY